MFALLRRLRLEYHRQKLLRRVEGGQSLHLEGVITVVAPEHFVIGRNVYIGTDAYINCRGGITIGDYSVLSRRVTIYSYDHGFKDPGLLPYDRSIIKRPVQIGKFVWIGMNAAIAPGARIGDGAVIGLNTVVSGDVPPNAIVVGAKARIIGYRDDDKVRRLSEEGKFLTVLHHSELKR